MIRNAYPALFLLLMFLVSTEIAVDGGWISGSLLPAPSSLWGAFQELRIDFSAAFVNSLGNVLIAWLLSISLGMTFALLLSLSHFLKRAVLPFAIFFQTVPIIAIAPLLVIYFGFGSPTVIASAFIVAVFPIIANTLIGLESASLAQQQLFQVYNASKIQTLLKLKLPTAYPFIYSGLKISAGHVPDLVENKG